MARRGRKRTRDYNGLYKVIIRVVDEETMKTVTVHVTFVQGDLMDKYKAFTGEEDTNMAEVLSRWVYEDFNVFIPFSRRDDVDLFRQLINEHYRTTYPDLYIDETQKWIRVWCQKKIREELEV